MPRPADPASLPALSSAAGLVLGLTQAGGLAQAGGEPRVPVRDPQQVREVVHEVRELNLPVEPGVRDARNALVRWAVLLGEVLP